MEINEQPIDLDIEIEKNEKKNICRKLKLFNRQHFMKTNMKKL